MIRCRRGFRALSAAAIVAGALVATTAPVSATHVACGALITESTSLDSDVGPCPGDGLVVTSSDVTLDLNGYRVFAANGAGDNAGVRLVRVTGVTVENGTVEGFDAGIAIMGGGGNTVRNTTVQNNVNDQLGPPCDLGDGIAMLNSGDNQILDNRLVANGPYGGVSVIENSDRNLISGNIVSGHNLRSRPGSGCGNTNQNEGIRIEGPGANDNVVENNVVEGSGLAGIGLHGYVCSDAAGDEMEDPNTGTIVRRNTVRGGEQDGIAFLQQGPATVVCPSWGNTIERNLSTGNALDGIFVAHNSHDNVISHNVVSGNGGAGLRLNDPTFTNQFTNVGPTLLDLVSPDVPPYAEGTDFRVMSGSGSGDVTGRLVPLDIVIGGTGNINTNPVDTSTSGCQQADYDAAGFRAGDIALIQRGTCTFVSKVALAVENGASAVVMFNEGQSGRTTFAFGSAGPVPIPVLSTTFAVGRQLFALTQAGPVTVHVVTNTTNVRTLAAPAPFDNTLIGNRGSGNAEVDGYDGNLDPPCDNNKWVASRFATVNQPCVVGPGGSAAAAGRTGERPGNPDRGLDGGDVHGRSAGSRLSI